MKKAFLRILEKETKAGKTSLTLRIKCIDPSSISSEVLLSSAASVIMSATLSPISMYKDILGLPEAKTLELESPFSKKSINASRNRRQFKVLSQKQRDVHKNC